MTNKTPSHELLRNVVSLLGGRTNAKDLCQEIVLLGYKKAEAQLAMQRAFDYGALKLNNDWSITHGRRSTTKS